MGTVVLIGTVKGGFLLRSDDRREWEIEPIFRGWKCSSAVRAPDGRSYAGTASWHYGATISHTDDFTEWTQLEQNYNSRTDMEATMIVDGVTYPRVGARFRGNTSYRWLPAGSQKKSFNVTMDAFIQG